MCRVQSIAVLVVTSALRFLALGLPQQSTPNSPLGPNPLRLEVGIGEHAAGWAACSFAFSFIVPQVLVQIALPLVCIVCMQQIMVMTRLQISSCLPWPG